MRAPTEAFIPNPRLRETDRIAVATDPATTWDLVRHLDLFELRYVRALFTLRGAGSPSLTLDQIVAPGNGFRRLAEDPGRFFVAGAVGRFWQRRISFTDVTAEDFACFVEPGFAKVAWSVEVYPRGDGGAWIVIDLRVDATSDDAWNAFIPYWITIGRFSRSIRRRWLRRFEQTLGRARSDAERSLPGDELLPAARVSQTEATTVEAPIADVWSSLQPTSRPDLRVLDVEHERALVLGSPSLLRDSPAPAAQEGSSYEMTWAYFLEPIGAGATRLIVRVRADFAETLLNQIARPLILAVHATMESAQLRHLKLRAEALAHPRT